MDLLEFGMENEKSESTVKRTLAKAALTAAKKQADLYEAYIESRPISFPEPDSEQMLQKIREGIAEKTK